MFSLKSVAAVLSLFCILASCEVMNIHIMKNYTKVDMNPCGTTKTLGKEDEANIKANGQIPGAECAITFNTQECGVCFQFEKYAFFNSTKASLVLTVDGQSTTFSSSNPVKTMYICSEARSLMMKIMHEADYMYDAAAPGYRFALDVYNKCGYRGSAKSVSFSDVVDHAKGYHHGQEMEDREMSNLVTGLCVGLALASVFLVVLLIAWCYVKNSPNRGASKSAGMPRGNRGNMNVQSGQSGSKPEVEMVAYKSKEGDRPEGKPLLTGAAAAVILSTEKKKERKNSASSASSASSDHGKVEEEEKKELISSTPAPEVTVTSSDSNPTSGGDSGYTGGSSSDYTSSTPADSGTTSGGGSSSDYTSGGGGYSYSGGGYSSGGGGFSSGGGGSSCGGGGSSCGGGGGSCGGGGGGSDD